jgi:hypothetical protein
MSEQSTRDFPPSCAFTYADTRRCRMSRAAKSQYCDYHRRKLLPLPSTREVTASLFEPIGQGFVPVTGLTQSLARLYACVAEGTVTAKDAIAMTRVAQTLLKTIPLSDAEFRNIYLKEYRKQLVEDSFGDLPDYQPAPKNLQPPTAPPKPPTPQAAHQSPQEAARPESATLPGGTTLPQSPAQFVRKLGL